MDSVEVIAERFSAKQGNFVLDIYPTTKILFALCVSILSVFSPSWIYGYTIFALCTAMVIYAGKFKVYWKSMKHILFLFVLVVILLRAIFWMGDTTTVFLKIWVVSFSVEGLLVGLNMTSIILSFSSSLLLMYTTTTNEDLMISLEKIGFSSTMSFIVLSTFQMIPELSARATTIQESQKSRSIETEGNIIVRAKAFFPMLSPLLLSSIASTEEKSVALESRGFNYPAEKTRIRVITDTRAQRMIRIIMVIATVALCCAGGYLKWVV